MSGEMSPNDGLGSTPSNLSQDVRLMSGKEKMVRQCALYSVTVAASSEITNFCRDVIVYNVIIKLFFARQYEHFVIHDKLLVLVTTFYCSSKALFITYFFH